MYSWHTTSIVKSSNLWNVKKFMANRPKGVSDEDWKEMVKNEKLNKKIMLDIVPKSSKKFTNTDEE